MPLPAAFTVAPPVLRRQAAIASGVVFLFHGRPLRVVMATGTDPAAPVVVEELTAVGDAMPGQYALWSAAAVTQAMAALTLPPDEARPVGWAETAPSTRAVADTDRIPATRSIP